MAAVPVPVAVAAAGLNTPIGVPGVQNRKSSGVFYLFHLEDLA